MIVRKGVGGRGASDIGAREVNEGMKVPRPAWICKGASVNVHAWRTGWLEVSGDKEGSRRNRPEGMVESKSQREAGGGGLNL
jgi:hypothetical protein